jgi:hypothetical protein
MIDATTITAAMLAIQSQTNASGAAKPASSGNPLPRPGPVPKNRSVSTGTMSNAGAGTDVAAQKANLKRAQTAYGASGEAVDPAAGITPALFSVIQSPGQPRGDA